MLTNPRSRRGLVDEDWRIKTTFTAQQHTHTRTRTHTSLILSSLSSISVHGHAWYSVSSLCVRGQKKGKKKKNSSFDQRMLSACCSPPPCINGWGSCWCEMRIMWQKAVAACSGRQMIYLTTIGVRFTAAFGSRSQLYRWFDSLSHLYWRVVLPLA